MQKLLALLLLLAGSSLFGQQGPEKTPAHGHPVSAHVTGVEIAKRVYPVYPSQVSAKALTEGVVVKLTIDKQGVPKGIHVTKGDPTLAKAGVEALRQWRWKPYKLNGEAVEVESTVYIRFDPLTN
jgi:protein TonB